MKKSLLSMMVIVIIIIPLLFSSCATDELLKTNSTSILLQACVYYSVPGFYVADLKGTSPEILEVDAYGRTLVSLEKYNWLSGKNELVYVICQKYEKSSVYFYEDVNYLFDGEDNSDLSRLKSMNDWNCQIDESKFSKREVRISFDLFLVKDSIFPEVSTENFYNSLSKTSTITQEEVANIQKCDWDGKDHMLYVIFLNSGEKYFCIFDKKYNTYCRKIESNNYYLETLQSIKAESGWYYGP